MEEFTQKDIEQLVSEHPFYGFLREWTLKHKSIQRLAWRMLKREKHSFHTFRRYLSGIKHLVDFLEAEDPDEALEKLKGKDATKVFDAFVGKLTKDNVKPINIKSIFYAVRKWAISNNVKVDWEFIARPKAVTKIKDRIPTVEELRTILSFAHIRDKALFLTMLSSGLRVGTVMSLKLKDYEPYEDLAIIHVEGGEGRKLSEGVWYWTFITPEARKTVDAYLDWRRRRGEELTPESPLFATVKKDEEFKYATNVSRQWRRLVAKAGHGKLIENTGWLDIHLHVLRKFFHTKCKGAGITRDYYDFWMGHTQGLDLADSYWREEIPRHVQEYRKAIPYLTVFETPTIDLVQQRKQQIFDMVKLLPNITNEKLEALKNLLAHAKTMKEVDEGLHDFMAMLKGEKREKRGLGTHTFTGKPKKKREEHDCQRIVSEKELPKYLKRGWRVQAVLPSGNVVVSND